MVDCAITDADLHKMCKIFHSRLLGTYLLYKFLVDEPCRYIQHCAENTLATYTFSFHVTHLRTYLDTFFIYVAYVCMFWCL